MEEVLLDKKSYIYTYILHIPIYYYQPIYKVMAVCVMYKRKFIMVNMFNAE